MKATTTNRQRKFIHTSAKYLFVFIKYCLESGVGSQFIAVLNWGKYFFSKLKVLLITKVNKKTHNVKAHQEEC